MAPTRLVELYDPPQCCPGGACSPDALDALVAVHEALGRIASEHRGQVAVRRYVFPRQLQSIRDPQLRDRLAQWQEQGLLPVTCIDGEVAKTGAYPGYEELLALTGLAAPGAIGEPS